MSFTISHDEYLHILGGPSASAPAGEAQAEPSEIEAVAQKMAEGRARAQALGLDPDFLGLNEAALNKIGFGQSPATVAPDTIAPETRNNPALPRLQPTQIALPAMPGKFAAPNILDNLQSASQHFMDKPLDALASIPKSIWADFTGALDALGGLSIGIPESIAAHDHITKLGVKLKQNPNDTEARQQLAEFSAAAQQGDADNRQYLMNLGKGALLFVPFIKPARVASAGLRALGAPVAADVIQAQLAKKTVAGIGLRLIDRAVPGAGIGGAYGYFSSDGDWEKSRQSALTMGAIFGAGPVFTNSAAAGLRAAGKGLGTIPAILGTLPGAGTAKRAFLEGPLGRVWDRGFAGAESIMRRTGVDRLADEMRLYRSESAILAGKWMDRSDNLLGNVHGDDYGAVASLIQRHTTPENVMAQYGVDAGRPIIRAAAGIERDLRHAGGLARAWGIPVFNPQSGEYYNFALKDNFFPHILPDPAKYLSDPELRKTAIAAVARNLKKTEVEATTWLDDWIERAKVGIESESRSGIPSEPTLDARLVDLPGYSLDLPNVLRVYYSKMGRAVAAHRRFGRWRSDLFAPLPDDAAAAEAVGQPLVIERGGAPRIAPSPKPGDLFAPGEEVGITTEKGLLSGTITRLEGRGGAAFGPSYAVKAGGKEHIVRETDLLSFRPGTAIPETAAERRARLGTQPPAVQQAPARAERAPRGRPKQVAKVEEPLKSIPQAPARGVPLPGVGKTLLPTVYKTVSHVVPEAEAHEVALRVAQAAEKGELATAITADARLAEVRDELHAIFGEDLLTGGIPYTKRTDIRFLDFNTPPPSGASFDVVSRGAAEELFPSVFSAIQRSAASPVHQEIMSKAAKEMLGYQLPMSPFERAVTQVSEKVIFPVEVVTKLSLGAVTQLSQIMTGTVRTQYRGAFNNMVRAFASDPEAMSQAMRMGIVGGQAIREAQAAIAGSGEPTQQFLKWVGFSKMDMNARIFGGLQGAAHADFQSRELYRLFKLGVPGNTAKMAAIESRLVRLGLDPRDVVAQRGILTEDQRLLAGQTVSYDVNFWGDSLSLPRFFRSPVGRVITQFKSFSFQQTQFVRDHVVKPWVQYGDAGPALRMAALIPLGGEAIADLKSFLRARERTDKVAQRVIENIAYGGGFGLAFDAMQQASRGMQGMASFVQGPAITDAESLISALEQIFEGNPKQAAEMAVRMAPGIIAAGGGIPAPVVAGAAAAAPAAAELLFPSEEKTTRQREQRTRRESR